MSVMLETLRHLLFFTIAACLTAYVIFIVSGKLVFASASGENEPTMVRDELSPGAHHLSGMVLVGSSCDELIEHVQQISDTLYEITFTTWQEPSVSCDGSKTPRAFSDVVFAPAVGVDFTATLDGAELSVLLLPVIDHSIHGTQ